MARTKGSFQLAGALEPLAAAALDARATVATKADLTASGSFPYFYVGMETYVVEENKKYRFVGTDPTVLSDWEEVGSGGGGNYTAGDGIIIDNSEISTDNMQTGDMEDVIYKTPEPVVLDDISDVTITDPTNGQALIYDAENDIWVNGSGGGGGGTGSLGESITASISVGGIMTGTTYAAGTSYDTLWKSLLNPIAYPTFTAPSATLSATGAKLLETGATLETTMTVTFSRGAINPAYGTSGYRSGVATDYALNGGTAQAGNTFNVTVDSSQTTYQATVNYEAGEQPKDSTGRDYAAPLPAGSVNSNTLTYEFTNALWANTSNITTIAKLALVSKSAKQKDFSFPAQTVANPEAFDVPANWTVTAVQVKNDLSGQYEDALSQFTVTNTTHEDAAGASVNYKRYTCNLGYPTGARSVRLKWS